MSILANAKQKAARGSVKEAFKNESGAIDLASIMVGIIVIGLIGGVIAATVFAVIPWAQDNAAKQQLDAIASAQSAYIGLSTEGGTAASFGGALISAPAVAGGAHTVEGTPSSTVRKIVGADAAVSQKLFDGTGTKLAVGNIGVGADAHYAAAIKSATNKVFYITDSKTQPTHNGTVPAPVNGFAAAIVNAANVL
jgi:type II secretory pathway pseudopilin PulG